ncbi:uncharacterized protein LOC106160939 isoform X2 [Lingula anatina]|uniref:Uncharacterized protein LOC106160939 isoform X2 n=1 Tax=Lingula anatina TaxID=7574 RepID=A0A1S3I5T1_LINAN|nr:uncharacterized protein LOC106160939 isoform X2 [Lingula anatina]|eukprot:XP_013393201.1 uncharacterized protein LOC106160939 isoform X2 [Lingula anatina]
MRIDRYLAMEPTNHDTQNTPESSPPGSTSDVYRGHRVRSHSTPYGPPPSMELRQWTRRQSALERPIVFQYDHDRASASSIHNIGDVHGATPPTSPSLSRSVPMSGGFSDSMDCPFSQSVPNSYEIHHEDARYAGFRTRRLHSEPERPPSYESIFGFQATAILAILTENESVRSIPVLPSPDCKGRHSSTDIVVDTSPVACRPRIPSAPPEVEVDFTESEIAIDFSSSVCSVTHCSDDSGTPTSCDRLLKSSDTELQQHSTHHHRECSIDTKEPNGNCKDAPAHRCSKKKTLQSFFSRPKYVMLLVFALMVFVVVIITLVVWTAR